MTVEDSQEILMRHALVNKHGRDPSDAERIAVTCLIGKDEAVNRAIIDLKTEEVDTLLAILELSPKEVNKKAKTVSLPKPGGPG